MWLMYASSTMVASAASTSLVPNSPSRRSDHRRSTSFGSMSTPPLFAAPITCLPQAAAHNRPIGAQPGLLLIHGTWLLNVGAIAPLCQQWAAVWRASTTAEGPHLFFRGASLRMVLLRLTTPT